LFYYIYTYIYTYNINKYTFKDKSRIYSNRIQKNEWMN